MTTRVQAALAKAGYFKGDISGELNDETRSALRQFQASKKLQVTGRMDIQTLTALGIKVN
jgi:His-Xaa-Ser repeat protein HxsA